MQQKALSARSAITSSMAANGAPAASRAARWVSEEALVSAVNFTSLSVVARAAMRSIWDSAWILSRAGRWAWDLIGIFGGVPLFTWILFGFVTRNSRCRKFEGMLREARTPEELSEVALRSEFALMLRLLGPHQGIRLERLRSELDDALAGETHYAPATDEPEEITEDQTHIVEDEMVTETVATGPSKDISGRVAEDGYEWTLYEGENYYRTPNSGADWQKWKD
mgnify:CR=1 FL=1